MNELKFGIAIEDGRIIAAFVNDYDRDMAIDVMREEFVDCEFDEVEIE